MKIIMILCLLFASCATQRFYLSEETTGQGLVPTYEGTAHFFLMGIGQAKEINARQICDDRPIRIIETHYSFLNGILSLISYGIYTPNSHSVYCGSKKKAESIQ